MSRTLQALAWGSHPTSKPSLNSRSGKSAQCIFSLHSKQKHNILKLWEIVVGGKSFLLELSIALAIKRGAIGEAVAVAPSSLGLQSLFKGLTTGLSNLSIGYRVKQVGRYAVSVTGPWFRVAYHSLESAKPATMLVVDEAGSVGIARLRKLSWRSGRVLVATTIHGYEGSGLALARMVEDVLPRPIVKLQLESPIRYSPNDLMEK
uniref:TcmA/NAT10 helicase domain-containing protein n=1 Tax=Fervidicoccus fontis TaxID=683846 RepID=A0A7J3ZK33_9CREN